MSYRRNNYGFGGYSLGNFGFGSGKNWFRQGRYKRNSKYSLENGLAMLLVGFVLLAAFGGSASVVSLITSLLPLIILIVVIYVLRLIYREYQRDKLSKTGIFDIDKMSGPEFENRLVVLYKNLGYQVEHTGKSGDLGVDLIIIKDGRRTAIQAKCWQGNVNERAVQEVFTGKTVHHCDHALIFTNSNFTSFARKVAYDTNVQLCGRNYLIKLLEVEQENLGRSLNSNSQNNPNWVDVASSWLRKQIPLSKDSVIQTSPQSINPIQQEQSHYQPNPELMKYISAHISVGEKWADLKVKLRQVGWKEEEMNEAFFKLYSSKTS